MHFIDRQDAAGQLAKALRGYGGGGVIYALPRGGVILGAEIAKVLGIPLDLVITRKIGHPLNPEYAVCAVTEDGSLVCNETEKESLNPGWLERAVARERAEAKRRRKLYLSQRPHIPATGKTAILVDDGIATGLTLRAAIQSVRNERAQKVVVAVPVAPHDVLETLRLEADTVVVLEDDYNYLGAVGAYYTHFPQVSDEEVLDLLSRGNKP